MLLAHIGTVNAERSLQILHRIAAPAAQEFRTAMAKH
jgi:hypothetical protein